MNFHCLPTKTAANCHILRLQLNYELSSFDYFDSFIKNLIGFALYSELTGLVNWVGNFN